MIEQAIDMLNSNLRPKVESGVDARFFRINDTWGFKYFGSPNMARLTREYQEAACDWGLAPRVGEFREFKIYSKRQPNRGVRWWGYVTECVERSLEQSWPDISHRYNVPIYRIDEYDYLGTNLLSLLRGMGMEELNYDDLDLHIGNVGWIDDNLLCFDFSGPAALELGED